ncbi:hypothetical protein ACET3Z_002569 [Daucus carota]
MDSGEAVSKASLSCEKSPGSLSLDTNLVKDSSFLNVYASSDSTSNSSGFVSLSSDDNGVMSSEEGFETASEKTVLEYQGSGWTDISTGGGGDSCENFVEFTEFSMLSEDVVGEFGDDCVGKNDEVGVLGGGEVEGKLGGSCEAFSGEEFSGSFAGFSEFSKSIRDVVGEVTNDVKNPNGVGVWEGGEVEEKLVDSCEDFSGEDVVGEVSDDGCVRNIQDDEKEGVTQAEGGGTGGEAMLEDNVHGEVVLTCNAISDNANGSLALVDQMEFVANSPVKVEEDKETGDAYILPKETYDVNLSVQNETIENKISGKLFSDDSSELNLAERKTIKGEDGMKVVINGVNNMKGLGSEWVTDGMIMGSSIAAKPVRNELNPELSGYSQPDAKSSNFIQEFNGHNVMESDGVDNDEEEEEEEEEEGKLLFDSSVLTDLLKATLNVGSGGNLPVTLQDLSRLISFERPACLGSSVQSFQPAARPNGSNFFRPSGFASIEESVNTLSEEEKRKLEKLQSIRVKFLRIVKRLGLSGDDPLVTQVLYHLRRIAGRQCGPLFGLDAAKRTALQLEEDGKEDTDFSLNILILGKSGVGKSATINSIFGEEKVRIDAFQPATSTVKEITGVVDGVTIRITKKIPLDVVLYVDRLDARTQDLDDLPLLQTINISLGSSLLQNAIVTLTHAASAPPEGPSGSPISYDAFVTQCSRVLKSSIEKAVGHRNMNGVCLVENHLACRTNKGQKVLPNGQIWKQQLMMMCHSIKILNEANSIPEPQESFSYHRNFGYFSISRSLPSLMSLTLESQVHQKLLSFEQGLYNCEADIDLEDLSDSDKDEDEYDQLPPFKPLKKSRLSKLSKEQRKAYFEEYDYRVKVYQKKQWKEELKSMKALKIKGEGSTSDDNYTDEDPADEGSFPSPSQFLAQPILDPSGWDHDCGQVGVQLLKRIATSSKFPAEIDVQLSKDKNKFTIHLVSSIATKHGEKGSSMARFDLQNLGNQLAYIIRGETKLKIFKRNKTAAGITITRINDNVITGLKLEDQMTIGRQYSVAASAGMVRSQQDVAYGANIDIQRREHDYPIGRIQSLLGLSMMWLGGEFALGLNSFAQFSIGRNSKVDVRTNINSNLTGQISVRTSSSDSPFMLATIIYGAISICKRLFSGESQKFLPY